MASLIRATPRRWLDGLRSYWRGPVSLKDPSFTSLFGGGPVSSGVPVNEWTAMNYSRFFGAVQVIAGDMSTLPVHEFERDGKTRRQVTDTRFSWCLGTYANPEMSAAGFIETVMAHALCWRGGYAEIERNGMGETVALWPLEPNRVQTDRTSSGELVYRVTEPTGSQVTLAATDVVHIRGLSFDGIEGYSMAQMARESIGVGLAAEKFTGSFFGNGSTFGGLLKTTEAYNEERMKEIRAAFANQHQGVEKAHRFGVLWNGMDYAKVGVDPSVAQLLETRKFQVEEIAAWFNLPPHKLRHLERATFSNIEHQGIDYVQSCLLRWTRRWEQELSYKCIPARLRGRRYVKFNLDGQQRGDVKSRWEAYGVGLDKGVLSRNEVRALEDLNPQPGEQGDAYLVQSAQVPLDKLVAGRDEPEPAEPADDDLRARFEAYGIALDRGLLSRNEIRARENMAPQPGEQGAIYTVQSSQVPLDQLVVADVEAVPALTSEPAAEDESQRAARASMYRDALSAAQSVQPRLSSSVEAAIYRAVELAAATPPVTIVWARPSSFVRHVTGDHGAFAHRDSRTVVLPPITSLALAVVALHEIAHVRQPRREDEHQIEREVRAWQWAAEHAIAWDDETEAEARKALSSVTLTKLSADDLLGLAQLDLFFSGAAVAGRRRELTPRAVLAVERRSFVTLHGHVQCRHNGCEQQAYEMVLTRAFCPTHASEANIEAFKQSRQREKKVARIQSEGRR